MRCGGLFETAESNGAFRCFFLFSSCDTFIVVTRWHLVAAVMKGLQEALRDRATLGDYNVEFDRADSNAC